jgi:Leucine-rich repeat (LRR) protein
MRKLFILLLVSFQLGTVHAQQNGEYNDLNTALKNVLHVKELYIREVTEKDLRQVGKFANLEILGIGTGELKTLPREIFTLKKLKELSVNWNTVSTIPKEIGNLINLRKLSLASNGLIGLPAEIGKLQNLIYLDISTNAMNELPKEIAQLKALEYLDLSGTIRLELDNVFAHLKNLNLKFISLSATGKERLPNSITQFKSLEKIELTHLDYFLDFEYTFNQLAQLPNLKSLDISGNPNLKTLPDKITDLKKLEELNIHNDYFNFELSRQLEKIKNLPIKKLNIGSAGLESIPKNITNLTHLESLSLFGNNEIYLGNLNLLSSLKNLKSLDLSERGVQILPEGLAELKALEELRLIENPGFNLKKSLGTLKRCTNLKIIDLSSFSKTSFTQEDIKMLKAELPKVKVIQNFEWK